MERGKERERGSHGDFFLFGQRAWTEGKRERERWREMKRGRWIERERDRDRKLKRGRERKVKREGQREREKEMERENWAIVSPIVVHVLNVPYLHLALNGSP